MFILFEIIPFDELGNAFFLWLLSSFCLFYEFYDKENVSICFLISWVLITIVSMAFMVYRKYFQSERWLQSVLIQGVLILMLMQTEPWLNLSTKIVTYMLLAFITIVQLTVFAKIKRDKKKKYS